MFKQDGIKCLIRETMHPRVWPSGRCNGLRIHEVSGSIPSVDQKKNWVVSFHLSNPWWIELPGTAVPVLVGGKRYPVELVEVPVRWPGHHGYKKYVYVGPDITVNKKINSVL